MTVKGNWLGVSNRHWRLVAWLEIGQVFPDHQTAARWYVNQRLAVPSNCMVPENFPLQLDHTAIFVPKNLRKLAKTSPKVALRAWDAEYKRRASKQSAFVVCTLICKDLHFPLQITDTDLTAVFGCVPATQTPRGYTAGEVSKLVQQSCHKAKETMAGELVEAVGNDPGGGSQKNGNQYSAPSSPL